MSDAKLSTSFRRIWNILERRFRVETVRIEAVEQLPRDERVVGEQARVQRLDRVGGQLDLDGRLRLLRFRRFDALRRGVGVVDQGWSRVARFFVTIL
jgi:hypothetical protein